MFLSYARRARKSEDGASAVEFSLIMPVLVLLVGGIVEGGFVFYTWGNMEFVGRQAARYISVGTKTNAEAETWAEARLATAVGTPTASVTATNIAGATSLENEIQVVVSIPGSELAGLTPFNILRPVTLTSTIKLHRET